MLMHLAIPTKGRAGRVTSLRYAPQATLYAPDTEAHAYRTCYPHCPIVPVPLDVQGITATRNWILAQAPDPYVVFLDDDVKRAGWRRIYSHHSADRPITPTELAQTWQTLFDVTEQLGYRIWGLATHSATRGVYPYKPFLWRSYVTASCMGILAHTGVRFDESYPVKEDYELCLRCMQEDGGVVAARYLYWENAHWSTPGGCKDYRTQAMERSAIERLMARYPGMIRQVTRGGSGYSIDLEV
jgi:hypothetical protein